MWPKRAFHNENLLPHSVHGGIIPVAVALFAREIGSGFFLGSFGLGTLKVMVVVFGEFGFGFGAAPAPADNGTMMGLLLM